MQRKKQATNSNIPNWRKHLAEIQKQNSKIELTDIQIFPENMIALEKTIKQWWTIITFEKTYENGSFLSL